MKRMKTGSGGMYLMFIGALIAFSGCAQETCFCDEVPKPDIAQYAKAAKLKPNAQRALDKVLSMELRKGTYAYSDEDITPDIREASAETKYVMLALENNRCALGDGQDICRLFILPGLCSDLDAILRTDSPSPKDLDHAIWMASILELMNIISFLENMGAPAGKYKPGEF